MKLVTLAILLALGVAGCGEYVDSGRSPARPIISVLEGASGAEPDGFGNPLSSDVITDGAIFSDLGRVTMRLILRDPGSPGFTAAPTAVNQVTFTRYRVTYRRADGRNTQGVDVPYGFDSATTFTVPNEGTITASFEVVRHQAKLEGPLLALRVNSEIVTTIADITFYGKDVAGNDVSATGSMQVNFGNFADPE